MIKSSTYTINQASKVMQNTVAVLLACFIAYAHASDVSVRRILDDTIQKAEAGGFLRFWREVCVSKDVTMTVTRSIKNMQTGEHYKLPSVHYGGYADDGCQAAIYQLTIPENLEPGLYTYQPRGVLSTGEVYTLPPERFRID